MDSIHQTGLIQSKNNSPLQIPVAAPSLSDFKMAVDNLLYQSVLNCYSKDYVTQTLLELASEFPELSRELDIPLDFDAIKTHIVEPAYQKASLEDQNKIASHKNNTDINHAPWRINYGTHASWSVGVGGEVNAGASMGLGNASGGGFYVTYGNLIGLDIGASGMIGFTRGNISEKSKNVNICAGIAIAGCVSVSSDIVRNEVSGISIGIGIGPIAGLTMSRSLTSGLEVILSSEGININE